MTAKCSLTKEQIARANQIFEAKCKYLLDKKTVIIVDIESGDFFLGSAEDEGYEAYRKYIARFGTGRPNMLYTMRDSRIGIRVRTVS